MKGPNIELNWPIPYEGVYFLAQREGCRLTAYQDRKGVWTIGWGETLNVSSGDTWTQVQADTTFCTRLTDFTRRVKNLLIVKPSEKQLAALVSLAYNIGVGAFSTSTALKCHNRGDFLAAANAIELFDKVTINGVKVRDQGLVNRRVLEKAMYLEGSYSGITTPETPENESSLVQSPIAGGSVVSIAGGLVTVMSTIIDPVKEAAEKLGNSPLVIIGIVIALAGVISLLNRRKQRREGWA